MFLKNHSKSWADTSTSKFYYENIFLILILEYHNLEDSATSSSGDEDEDENENQTRSGSPTPCNSPKMKRKSISRQLANIPTLVRQQKVFEIHI